MTASVDPVRFDKALNLALAYIRQSIDTLAPQQERVLLVRDLFGRFRIFLDRSDVAEEGADFVERDAGGSLASTLDAFAEEFARVLGNYSAPPGELIYVAPEFFDSADALSPLEGPSNLLILDRLVTGREWLLPPTRNLEPKPPRAVFFGLKGGVGRTTALTVLAWHLSRLGKKVLVVDLDLESPGVAHSLLPSTGDGQEEAIVPGWPEFGVTDWFVEDAAGQADSGLLQDMVGSSPLASNGDILVVPACGGRVDQEYVSKLARAYVDMPQHDGERELFGDRLARMLDQLESHCQPDVVLLDCRAGLHDISSAALTRLGARNYLFALDTRQTWEGYRHLFRHWLRNPERLRELRQQLRTFAALVPNGISETEYRRDFCERAYSIFIQIYDQDTPPEIEEEDEDVYNFGPDDESAPHYPTLIRYHPDYTLFAPLERAVQLDEAKIQLAFGDFLETATSDLFPEDAR